jgi:putative aminopeptidase FrvX
MKLNRLKEVLSVPSYFGEESRMIEYLTNVLEEGGHEYTIDNIGNIYVTKGISNRYPCFVSHTDTVHHINENLTVIENKESHLIGIDSETGLPLGIGGDDKCGVYLCLEMLDKLDTVKVAFFVGEEFGMIGSKEADPEFFKDVCYAIQFDSPYGNTMSLTLRGQYLFDKESKFGDTVSPILIERGITEWQHHPYTDAYQLITKFDFPCLNIAAGYHMYHTKDEYVVVDEVENSYQLANELVEALGKEDYTRVKKNDSVVNYY